MNPEDVFYRKMGSVENLTQIMDRKNRFGTYNEKTLGFCMVSRKCKSASTTNYYTHLHLMTH